MAAPSSSKTRRWTGVGVVIFKSMSVKIRSPEVAAHAPRLLADYRSPFSGLRGADDPLVFAGFVISNSAVGHGSFSITPQITIQVCDNGMTFTRDAGLVSQ